jgi:uncharacterized SAM-binding protein YcdF (DUF218 family)
MFLLSKIVGLLLNPLLWVLIFLLWSYFTRVPGKQKKTAAIALLVFLFFSNTWIIHNILANYQYKPRPMQQGEQYSAGILLGGLAGYDEQLQLAFFNSSSDRFIQTLKLYKEGHIRKIIVSGGNAIFAKGGFREADFLKENLMACGVPAVDILSERDAKNTIENSRFTHQITDSLQLTKPYVLITSAFHMPRAIRIFKKEGMEVRPFPCAYLVLTSDKVITWQSILPSANAMNLWSIYLKEQVGTMVLSLSGK